MHRRNIPILILAVLALATGTNAQYTREFAPWPVIAGSDTLAIPFWGGINDPKPTLVDFDRDGRIDLLLGDNEGLLGYFRNIGTASSPEWTAITERLGGIDIATWHLPVDIDADGDLDLLCDARNGYVAFYRNNGGSGADVTFTLEDTAWFDIQTGFNNTPAMADIDADGDLDFFLGGTSGALEFFRNDGDSTAPLCSLTENFYDSILAFPGGGKSAANPNHGFSNIAFIDIDNDHDLDLFWGDIFNTNLYYFENTGDSTASALAWGTEFYLNEATRGFNHPRFADLDNDGDFDMVLGVANSSAIDNLQFLRNAGSADQAFFIRENLNLIGDLDIGSYSQPAFGDIDSDNDLDLLIGGGDGRITLFRNTGTAVKPSMELVSADLDSIDVGLNAAPALADWDGDGLIDLLIGTQGGRVELWRNIGTPIAPAFVQDSAQLGGIKVDQFAVPRPVDLDHDGDLDLILGEWDFNSNANVLLYENTGTPQAPVLTLVTASLLPRQIRDYTVPEPYDWNHDGVIDLVVGGRGFGLTVFLNSAAPGAMPDSTLMAAQPDSLPGGRFGTYLALRFADIDHDGDDDIFLGEANGGLSFWRADGSCCTGMRGNVDNSADDAVNISDLTALVAFLFQGQAEPVCRLEANIDSDTEEAVNISDLTYLVANLFQGGPPPGSCP